MSLLGAIFLSAVLVILIALGMMLALFIKENVEKKENFDGRETKQLDTYEHGGHVDDVEQL